MKRRDVALSVILTIVTCGIYGIYWFYCIADELYNENTPNSTVASPAMAILLTIVTCGIYGIYLWYKWGEAMPEVYAKYGRTCENRGTMYLLFAIFNLSIVNYCLIQSDINALLDGGSYQYNNVQPNQQQYPPQY